MVYVPVESLKPGMVLGRSLPSIFFGVSLLNVNEPFSLRMINKLRKLRIPGVYIKDGLTDDIEIQEIFTPKQMDKLVLGVKKQFDSFASSAVISNESVDDFTAMSGEIVSTVLQSDEILYNMINIKSYDNYTYSHSMMVSLLSVLIGERMGLGQKDLNNVAMAGLMHDIGK
ncbi:MAG: HD domain-containing protein, partial [Oscillospiraceae bacterium]